MQEYGGPTLRAFSVNLGFTFILIETTKEHSNHEIIPTTKLGSLGGINASDQGRLLERIEELIRRRSLTDRRMGYVWMVVPILPVLVGLAIVASFVGIIASALSETRGFTQAQTALPVVSAIIGLYALAIASVFLILLVGAFAFYYLVDRRNNHFKRQQQLFATIYKYLSCRANAPANDSLFRLGEQSEESIFEERDRPAGLWSILYLFVTPIVGLILAYNLDQDLRRHEELQSSYEAALTSILSEMDPQPTKLTPQRLHKRDPILFIVITAVTGGLFWIYWFYTLLKDYNEHFLDQSQFEDQVLAVLKPQPLSKHCSVCGETIPETAKFCPYCGKMQ